MYFYHLLSSHALTTSYLQSNLTNYFYYLPFSLSPSTKKKQLFPGRQGPDSSISYMHTEHMLHFLRSIHCKLDILCIVKTLSSAYHKAKLVLFTNLLPILIYQVVTDSFNLSELLLLILSLLHCSILKHYCLGLLNISHYKYCTGFNTSAAWLSHFPSSLKAGLFNALCEFQE